MSAAAAKTSSRLAEGREGRDGVQRGAGRAKGGEDGGRGGGGDAGGGDAEKRREREDEEIVEIRGEDKVSI